MILLANGCSHTAGAEIEYAQQGQCYEKAWPFRLADTLKYDHLNLSISGASAERISRTTIEYFLKEFEKPSYKNSDYFVTVSWPGFYRTEIFNGGFDDGWQPLVVGNDDTYKKQMSFESYAFYKAWTLHAKPHPQTISYFHDILLLQYFLTAHRIKFLFWNASNSTPHKENYLHLYFKQVYHKRFPYIDDFNYSYCALLENNGFEYSPVSEYAHYGEDAQIWFADYLHKYLTNNNLL